MKSIYKKIFLMGFFLITLHAGKLFASDEKSFSNPQAALQALSAALQNKDTNKALTEIFGKNSSDLWNSGDSIQDEKNKAKFVQRLSENNNKWMAMDATHQVLFMGKE
jgi:hypothetical protein